MAANTEYNAILAQLKKIETASDKGLEHDQAIMAFVFFVFCLQLITLVSFPTLLLCTFSHTPLRCSSSPHHALNLPKKIDRRERGVWGAERGSASRFSFAKSTG